MEICCEGMIRKTLTILSLIGLLLSVGLWGVSYFRANCIPPGGTPFVALRGGQIALHFAKEGIPWERSEDVETRKERRMNRKLLGWLVVLSALCTHWFSPQAQACSCGTIPSANLEVLLKQHDVAFLGEVIEGYRPAEDFYPGELLVRVSEVWEGVVYEEQGLRNVVGCEAELLEGDFYLILTNHWEGQNYHLVSICSTVLLMSEAEELLEELGMGEPPLSGSSRTAACGIVGLFPAFFLAAGLLSIRFLPLPSQNRRRKRKKLGLCLKCGYDLRGSKDKCSECGQEFETATNA